MRLALQQFVADKTAEILLIRRITKINQSSYNILQKHGRDMWILQNTCNPPPPKKQKTRRSV